MIPTNAQTIIDARKRGYKPDELVLVSLMGRINEPNHTVYAEPDKDYEWQWAKGLQVCIYSSAGIQWRRVAMGLIHAKTEFLSLWDTGRAEGAEIYMLPTADSIHLPKAQWRWQFEYIPWTPIQNAGFACN